MMMIGDRVRPNPTVQISPWDYHFSEDPTAHIYSPVTNNNGDAFSDGNSDDFDFPADAFSSDNFRMFEFKVKKCSRARSHDWTDCPFAHPGEKACRRDPRRCRYSGSACPDFRKGACKMGDACEYAHGVFECWLHPSRYRTQPCKDGTHCRRRVCFFAHTPDQLRVLPYSSPDGSPGSESPVRFGRDPILYGSSPNSTFYSPPLSPATDSPTLSQLTESVRGLKIDKLKTGLGSSPPSWGFLMGSGFGPSMGFCYRSLPTTPIRATTRSVGLSAFDIWEMSCQEEEPAMERVESGRKLREGIYAKLGKDNSLDRVGPAGEFQDP